MRIASGGKRTLSSLLPRSPTPGQTSYVEEWGEEVQGEEATMEGQASSPHLTCTSSLLLRFWVNALKNPQLTFDVRVSDNEDAILAVIAQTFIDSCVISEHKVGRVRA